MNLKNISFDVDHRFQVTDCSQIDLRFGANASDSGGLSDERWSGDVDIRGFASVLFEIIVGHPSQLSEVRNDETIFPGDIPMFVRDLIVVGQSPESELHQSFNDIFDILKENDFRIVSGVDSADFLAFVEWTESFESWMK
jgi:hypothetical protein